MWLVKATRNKGSVSYFVRILRSIERSTFRPRTHQNSGGLQAPAQIEYASFLGSPSVHTSTSDLYFSGVREGTREESESERSHAKQGANK